MIRSQQEELQRIVEALEKKLYESSFPAGLLEADTDFQILKRMAYAERHPEVQPNRVTALTWEQLLSMGDEAARLEKVFTPYSNGEEKALRDKFKATSRLIIQEKQRRLLNLLPNAKTE